MNCEPAIRYFFHVRRGGFTYQDTRGTWFSTPDEARTHAELIATELAPDGIWQDAWFSTMRSGHGTVLLSYWADETRP